MDMKALEHVMVTHGLVIRAIPLKVVNVFEANHIDKYPNGTVYYDEHFKRNMLRVERVPKNAGKFLIESVNGTGCTVIFSQKSKFYDTIEEAIHDLL